MFDFFKEKRHSNAQVLLYITCAALSAIITDEVMDKHDQEHYKQRTQKVQDSLLNVNDSLQRQIVEYQEALKACVGHVK